MVSRYLTSVRTDHPKDDVSVLRPGSRAERVHSACRASLNPTRGSDQRRPRQSTSIVRLPATNLKFRRPLPYLRPTFLLHRRHTTSQASTSRRWAVSSAALWRLPNSNQMPRWSFSACLDAAVRSCQQPPTCSSQAVLSPYFYFYFFLLTLLHFVSARKTSDVLLRRFSSNVST